MSNKEIDICISVLAIIITYLLGLVFYFIEMKYLPIDLKDALIWPVWALSWLLILPLGSLITLLLGGIVAYTWSIRKTRLPYRLAICIFFVLFAFWARMTLNFHD